MLVACDHRGPGPEPAFAAGPGTDVACANVLKAWEARRSDPRLLAVLTRGQGDRPVPPVERQWTMPRLASFVRRHGVYELTAHGGGLGTSPPGTLPQPALVTAQFRPHPTVGDRHGSPAGAQPEGEGAGEAGPASSLRPPNRGNPADDWASDLDLLARLGSDVPLRLVAAVTAQLLNDMGAGRPGADRALPALEASLVARATKALSDWLGDSVRSVQRVGVSGAPVRVRVAQAGTRATVEEDDDGSVGAVLPLCWVVDVWGRRLAVVGNRFSVALVEASPGRVVLETIGADLDHPRLLTVGVT